MTIYVERTDDGLQTQVDNFLLKAPLYPALGLNAAKLTALRADWTLMKYLLAGTNAMSTYATALTTYKNLLRRGTDLGTLPPTPVLTAAPPITTAGYEARFRELIQDAVRSTAMTDAIAQDLGIVAPAATTAATESTTKPTFKLEFSSGGYPNIIWKKGKYEGIEIHKSKDGINFSKLDKDYKPDYTDKSDLPQPTKAEVWYYKLIYIVNDEHTGQWSDVQSIAVSG